MDNIPTPLATHGWQWSAWDYGDYWSRSISSLVTSSRWNMVELCDTYKYACVYIYNIIRNICSWFFMYVYIAVNCRVYRSEALPASVSSLVSKASTLSSIMIFQVEKTNVRLQVGWDHPPGLSIRMCSMLRGLQGEMYSSTTAVRYKGLLLHVAEQRSTKTTGWNHHDETRWNHQGAPSPFKGHPKTHELRWLSVVHVLRRHVPRRNAVAWRDLLQAAAPPAPSSQCSAPRMRSLTPIPRSCASSPGEKCGMCGMCGTWLTLRRWKITVLK